MTSGFPCSCKLRCGVFTTGRTWYLCMVGGKGLQISPPISCDSRTPPLLAAVSFIMTRALCDQDKSRLLFPTGQQSPAAHSVVEMHRPA